MKKLIAVAMFLVACIGVNAQFYVGGSFGFESSKENKDDKSLITWSAMPEIGFALNDIISFGIQFGYSSQEVIENVKNESLTVSPYTRFTFAKSGIARFFIDGGITFSSIDGGNSLVSILDQFYFIDGDDKGTQMGFGIRPGIMIVASPKINLVAKLGYLGYHINSEDLGGGSSFGFSMDNTDISFGVFYKF